MRRFFLILNYFSLCCILDLRFTTTTSAVSLWGDVHITSVIYSSLSLRKKSACWRKRGGRKRLTRKRSESTGEVCKRTEGSKWLICYLRACARRLVHTDIYVQLHMQTRSHTHACTYTNTDTSCTYAHIRSTHAPTYARAHISIHTCCNGDWRTQDLSIWGPWCDSHNLKKKDS